MQNGPLVQFFHLVEPFRHHLLLRYGVRCDAKLTVATPIAIRLGGRTPSQATSHNSAVAWAPDHISPKSTASDCAGTSVAASRAAKNRLSRASMSAAKDREGEEFGHAASVMTPWRQGKPQPRLRRSAPHLSSRAAYFVRINFPARVMRSV